MITILATIICLSYPTDDNAVCIYDPVLTETDSEAPLATITNGEATFDIYPIYLDDRLVAYALVNGQEI